MLAPGRGRRRRFPPVAVLRAGRERAAGQAEESQVAASPVLSVESFRAAAGRRAQRRRLGERVAELRGCSGRFPFGAFLGLP